MTSFRSTHRVARDDTFKDPSPPDLLKQLAQQLRSHWAAGRPVRLAAFLEQHTELYSDRSLLIDLAVDEYRLRRELGQTSSIRQFCHSFSNLDAQLQSSIFRQIEVEKYYADHPAQKDLYDRIDWPHVGDSLANYQVLEELGRGALARVYLCTQTSLGDRQVVVKVSRRGTQEGHTLGKLQHPHITAVHSIESAAQGDLYYLCMPYLGKSTLQDLIERAYSSATIPTDAEVILQTGRQRLSGRDLIASLPPTLPLNAKCSYLTGILQLAVKLTSALSYAHDMGIYHLDLKPNNVLLTPQGQPVLLDFNLARDDQLMLDVRGGTLRYMSPEQIATLLIPGGDENLRCDEKSEIFSLGVVLYELLCGKLPFAVDAKQEASSTLPSKWIDVQKSGPKPLTEHNPRIPARLDKTVCRCLAFQREQRYESMQQLQAALLRELSPRNRLSRWVQVHRTWASSIAVASVACCLALLGWLMVRPPYPLREYQRGLRLQATEHHQEAVAAFQQALHYEPLRIDAAYASARSKLLLGNLEQAQIEFAQLATEHNHPQSMAHVGYCFNLLEKQSMAVPWYEKALDCGNRAAWIYNNLAVSCSLGRTKHSAEDRQAYIQENLQIALSLAPDSPVVLYNSLLWDVERMTEAQSSARSDVATKLKRLLTLEPTAANAYRLVPLVYRGLVSHNSARLEEAMDLLQAARVSNVNLDMESLLRRPEAAPFRNHKRYAELVRTSGKQSARQEVKIPRFLEPDR